MVIGQVACGVEINLNRVLDSPDFTLRGMCEEPDADTVAGADAEVCLSSASRLSHLACPYVYIIPPNSSFKFEVVHITILTYANSYVCSIWYS